MSIRLENVCKGYGGRAVLENFSFEFPAGVTVVMGPSGRGKTTLLRLMLGLEAPDGGSITGVPERVAAVFQEDRLPMDFTAPACVMMAAPKDTDRGRVLAQLAQVGLGDELSKPVRELSGGQRRRVAVVRAVAARPEALFLDEAFTGLDGAIKSGVAAYITENTRGSVVVAVTHDESDAALLGGRILRL
jgi:NitT/TauT family transport system ATP-binding protein